MISDGCLITYRYTVAFPATRMRRLRRHPVLRELVAETALAPTDLIAPLFVREGIDEPQPIASLPGVVQHTTESLAKEAHRLVSLGVPAVVLFGVPLHKDAGREWCQPIRTASSRSPCAVWPTTWGIGWCSSPIFASTSTPITATAESSMPAARVDNDLTLERYAEVAVAQATAGATVVAPSGMMDGQVAAIRAGLDGAGFSEVAILAYAAKYASALYGPFRDAVDVTIAGGGDRRGYQQDYRNRREAEREVDLDIDEGADMVMVKPALAYLDVIAAVRARVDVPVAAYHVSGEYAMIKAAAERGWIDGAAVALEHTVAIKRAGADLILTYLAGELAETLHA